MKFLRSSILALLLFLSPTAVLSAPLPLNCSDADRLCTSFIAFKPTHHQTFAEIQSMFDVLPEDISIEGNGYDYFFIKKNCSCSSGKRYFTNTTFTVKKDEGSVYAMVIDAYSGLAFLPNTTRKARAGAVVSLHLFCGCSSRLWNYLVSYVMQERDTIASLASRFGVSMEIIETVNGIADPNNVTVGSLYYIPLNSVPGEPYSIDKGISSSPAPATPPVSADINFPDSEGHHSSHFPYGWILGSMGVALVLILGAVIVCVSFKSRMCCNQVPGSHGKDPNRRTSHKFQTLQRPSFCYGSGRYLCCKSGKWDPKNGDAAHHQMNVHVPKAIVTNVLDVEKPIVFSYEDIFSSTDGFSDANLLGNGMYGSVYYGVLHDQEVAIKRMTATKTKEFMVEMKVLCKVHHMNLVELIGYAATDDELFLIYEFAQKGSLKSHLHDPQNKGHTSLSWIARVQIALDAARGLEYIHEHTKAHYVHRDVKTSNILLDSALRAKISDFGLAKLIGKTGDGEASVTKVVGTFGYLAPEYLRDGFATTKSDVYAFGVVLFEIISGKEAITRTAGRALSNNERRSLASIMLAALKHCPSSVSMEGLKEYIDPNLADLYPYDCVCKVAMLAKQCVDEDPILRPDMKDVVISLSQILLSSIEWEATLAGNSQIFSGLVQGR
ncbi:lysM domain receptor-like kinase 3 [Aristolochia californica]|uniref:lysM domain receptor-like kinase 3 n=1 Tax=Aristolochia californica TaxID=171875 RepID=UPI0035E22AD5